MRTTWKGRVMFAPRRDPARAAALVGRRPVGAIAAVTGVALAALLTSAGTPATVGQDTATGAPAVLAAAVNSPSPASSAPGTTGTWGTAVEVPGTAALNN